MSTPATFNACTSSRFETHPTAWTQSRSLLAFACDRKSLGGPVTGVLLVWRHRADLGTVLKASSVNSWTITHAFVHEMLFSLIASSTLPKPQSLLRRLLRDEWERFEKYTARVTTLGIQLLGMESRRGGFGPGFVGWSAAYWDFVPFFSPFLTP
jgi:hypothetical protein